MPTLQIRMTAPAGDAIRSVKSLQETLRREVTLTTRTYSSAVQTTQRALLLEERTATQSARTMKELARAREIDARAARNQARDIERLRKEEEKAAQAAQRARQQGNAFSRAVLSSRFSLPGTGGRVQPLVGRTAQALGMSENGAAGLAVAGGAAAIVGAAALSQAKRGIELAADFQQSMNVLRVTLNATGGEMDSVAAAARKLGADTKLPATSSLDAAKAMTELAKAGLSVKDTMGAARGTLELAAAAQIDAGEAANITASQLKAFNLSGSEAGRVADLLAAAANTSLGSITDMAQAAQQASTAFAQAGIPIEDMTTAIAEMANAGIKGSDAGTSLRVMISRLMAPTDEGAKLMKALGIQVFDNQGKFLGLRKVMEQFSKATSGATVQQKAQIAQTIFGQDAMRAYGVVIDGGAKKFDELKKSVTEAGAAQKTADAQTQGLKGALEGFQSTVDSFLEKHAAPFLGFFEDVVKKAGEAIDWIGRFADAWNGLSPGGAKIEEKINARPAFLDIRERAAESQRRAEVMGQILGEPGFQGGSRLTHDSTRLTSAGLSITSTRAEVQEELRRVQRSIRSDTALAARLEAQSDTAVDKAVKEAVRKRGAASFAGAGGTVEQGGGNSNVAAALAAMNVKKGHSGRGGGSRTKRTPEQIAEQKALRDAMGADQETASGAAQRVQAAFSDALDLIGSSSSSSSPEAARNAAARASALLLRQQLQSANVDFTNESRTSPKTAAAAFTNAQDTAFRAIRERRKQIEEAYNKRLEAAQKKQNDALEKRADDEAARTQKSYEDAEEFLKMEAEALRFERERTVSIGRLAEIAETEYRNAVEQAQMGFIREGLFGGDPNAAARFAQRIREAQDARSSGLADIRYLRAEQTGTAATGRESTPFHQTDFAGTRGRGSRNAAAALLGAAGVGQDIGEAISRAILAGLNGEGGGRTGGLRATFDGLGKIAGQSMARRLTEALIDRPLQRVFDGLADRLANGIAQGGMIAGQQIAQGAGALLAAAGILTGGGKKKKGGILGGILGAIAGSFIPGIGTAAGFAIGSNLGQGNYLGAGLSLAGTGVFGGNTGGNFSGGSVGSTSYGGGGTETAGAGRVGNTNSRGVMVVNNHYGDVNDKVDRVQLEKDRTDTLTRALAMP